MFVIGFFDVVEMLAGYTIDLTGLGYVLEIFCKFKYAQFTFNQFFLGGHAILLFSILFPVLALNIIKQSLIKLNSG